MPPLLCIFIKERLVSIPLRVVQTRAVTEFDLTLSQTSPGLRVCSRESFENTMGKGEIARHEQFLLFPVFSTLLTLSQTSSGFYVSHVQVF